MDIKSELNKVCVTGAGGFVGKALSLQLQEQGYSVHAIARRETNELTQSGVNSHIIDITKNPEKLGDAFQSTDTVFHVASKVDMWGKYRDFYDANVVGTQNIIQACIQCGVKRLVYTSSPSVVADGSNLRGIDESYPIPAKHKSAYSATKAIAEKEVLAANSDKLSTLSLRPHLIFGPGDNHFIPTILDRAKKGRLVIVGDGQNMVDVCFIEDCVRAHICAMNAMISSPAPSGKAYFISQGQPIGLWDFINIALSLNGIPELTRRVPKAAAQILARIMEISVKVSPIKIKPLFTEFLVSEMTTDHYFDISASRNLLGFIPEYSVQDALLRTFKK